MRLFLEQQQENQAHYPRQEALKFHLFQKEKAYFFKHRRVLLK